MQSPASATEVQCFKLFFTEELVGEIVEETNRYASELQEKMAPGVLGKMARWVPTTIKKMHLLLMAVLLMGVIKKTSLRHYWSTDPLLQTPFFGTLFSQDHFLPLLHCLHFTNSARVSHHDPLHKIRRIFTAITPPFIVFLSHIKISVWTNHWWNGKAGWPSVSTSLQKEADLEWSFSSCVMCWPDMCKTW